jgi:HlyD family secretion protein
MKTWHIIAAVVVAIIAWALFSSNTEEISVRLVKVTKGAVENTVSNTRAGTVKACQRSRLSLPIGGQIDKLYVTEGDSVTKGQLLMSLWNEDRIAQVEIARAQIVSSHKERESICIASRSDAHEAQRLIKLVAQKLTSVGRADIANAKSQASSAACEAALARENKTKASLVFAEAILEQTYLTAPFAGKVAEVTGEIGEFSTPSPPGVPTPPAIDLLTDDCHYISAPIDEVDASKITQGMPARVTMDAFRGRIFPATVRRVSTYVMDYEKQARTVEVEANLNNIDTDTSLLAGYSADMEIILQRKESSLRIPSELLIEDQYVLTLQDGVLKKQDVTIGLTNWHFSEILDGLNEGDYIVSNIGAQGITAGATATENTTEAVTE